MLRYIYESIKSFEITMTGGFAVATVWLWIFAILQGISYLFDFLKKQF